MSSFDDSFVLSDVASFAEMGSEITLNGRTVRAVISPISSYQTQPDGSGGFQRIEGARVEIASSEIASSSAAVGVLVIIPGVGSTPPQSYRVQQIKSNGYTTSLILGSTSGTAVQF